jgi:hypothetical protein
MSAARTADGDLPELDVNSLAASPGSRSTDDLGFTVQSYLVVEPGAPAVRISPARWSTYLVTAC